MGDNPALKRKRLRSQTLRRRRFCPGREQVPGRRNLFCFPCLPQTFTSRWVKPHPWGLALLCAPPEVLREVGAVVGAAGGLCQAGIKGM